MPTLNPRQLATRIIDTVGNALLSPPFGGQGLFYNHGPRTERKVALTFDDGPNKPSTANLLDALDDLNVPSTFFCVGWQVRRYPDLIRKMHKTGHVIGNHSMGHRRKDGIMITGGNHIDDSEREIAELIGCRPRLYRPPWGWLTPWEGQRLKQRGYAIIGWDVYTLDWKLPEIDAGTLAKGICRDVQPGSIILLHDSHGIVSECHKFEMIRAVQLLVPQLRAEGYEFVSVPKLLGVPAYSAL